MHAAVGMPMLGAGRFIEGGMGLGVLVWLAHVAFWLLAMAGIALLVRAIANNPSRAAAPASVSAIDAASAIARERLARGEIEPDQYQAIVAALNGHYGVTPPFTPTESTTLDG